MLSREADIVQEHINECERALQSGNSEDISKVGTMVVNLYNRKILALIQWRIFPGGAEKLNFLVENLKLYQGELLDNIKKEELKNKTKEISLNNTISNSGNSTNTNTNINTNDVDLKVMFESARKEIGDNGSLTQEDIDEILAKINEIEEISGEDTTRPRKWSKLKGTINWLTTKGVDVGVKLYPLIMTALENNN